MSDVIRIEDADLKRELERLKIPRDELFRVFEAGGRELQTATKSSLVAEFPAAAHKGTKGAFRNDPAPVEGVKLYSTEKGVFVSITKDARLRWIENGTQARTTKRKGYYRGMLDRSGFFDKAYSRSVDKIRKIVFEHLEKYIKGS